MKLAPSSTASTGSGQLDNVASTIRLPIRKTIALIIACLLFLMIGGIISFHAYVAWILARPNIAPLISNPERAIGLAYEKVQFLSSDHSSTVHGWYIPGNSDKTVIFSHGYGGNREEIWVPLYDLAKVLNTQQYNVLMFDYGYVSNESRRIVTGGVYESRELLGAVEYSKQHGASKVFIWGFSMGAGTALQAALHNIDITGMILDSMFLLEPETLYHNMKQQVNLPRFPSLQLVSLFFPILNDVSLHDIPYREIKETQYEMPIFWIHGKEDDKAPHEIAQLLFENQSPHSNSKLWLLPHGTHELIYKEQPDLYLEKTMSFLNDIAVK